MLKPGMIRLPNWLLLDHLLVSPSPWVKDHQPSSQLDCLPASLAALNTPQMPWGSYTATTAACYWGTTLVPDVKTVSNSLCHTFLPSQASVLQPFSPRLEREHFPWWPCRKSMISASIVLPLHEGLCCDWYKHRLSFEWRPAMTGAKHTHYTSFLVI
jgi:hypothetical protein